MLAAHQEKLPSDTLCTTSNRTQALDTQNGTQARSALK